MQRFVTFLEIWLGASWAIQCFLCWVYTRTLRTQSQRDFRNMPAESLPKICVIMPLRGGDPFLKNAIQSVLDSDYPNLQLRIVVDDHSDEAHATVQRILSERDSANVSVRVLQDKSPHRSLVCSSVIQEFEACAESCDVIAFCAADTVVPPDWYRHIAYAMSDPQVGSTLGNRWYLPAEGRWGSLVRVVWNSGASVLMWLFQIPWSGAAALRPGDVRQSGLRQVWETSLVEDVPIFDAMQRAGLKMKFVPELTNINREETDLRDCFRFVKRQMIWARLYHPHFALVVSHAVITLATFVIPWVTCLVLFVHANYAAGAWLAFAAFVYLLGLTGLLAYLESTLGDVVSRKNEEFPRWSVMRWLRMTIAIAFTQVIYPLALFACCFVRNIDWRGIRYRILGKDQVQMVEYVPFSPAAGRDGKTSI